MKVLRTTWEILRDVFVRVVDRLPKGVAKKLDSFPESSMDCWIIAVKTKNGKIFRQVAIGHDVIGYSTTLFDEARNFKLPFRLRDVVDIEWEGYRVGNTVKRPEPFRDEWRFESNKVSSPEKI